MRGSRNHSSYKKTLWVGLNLLSGSLRQTTSGDIQFVASFFEVASHVEWIVYLSQKITLTSLLEVFFACIAWVSGDKAVFFHSHLGQTSTQERACFISRILPLVAHRKHDCSTYNNHNNMQDCDFNVMLFSSTHAGTRRDKFGCAYYNKNTCCSYYLLFRILSHHAT